MIKRLKLKTKFILFLFSFTFLLVSIIIIYFYISDRNYIQSQISDDVDLYTKLYVENIRNELNRAISELTGLRTQLDIYLKRHENTQSNKEPLFRHVKEFITGYPYKYADVSVINFKYNEVFRISPVIAFGGEILADIQTGQHINNLSKKIRQAPDTLSNKPLITGPQSGTKGYLVTISFPVKDDSELTIAANLSFDYLIDRTNQNLNLPGNITPVITDSAGVILYSQNEHFLQQFFHIVYPDVHVNFSDRENKFTEKYCLWKQCKLITPDVNIFIRAELKDKFVELNTKMVRIFVFTGIVIIIIILSARYVADSRERSLHEVTRIAKMVAQGDFSQKITLQRQDELGTLIDTFNDMVDKLKFSYNQLNQVNIELESKIKELIRTRAELTQKQRLALIGEVISKISHEIQNKIGGVSIWVQNLELLQQNDETTRVYIAEIKEALGSLMNMLINFKQFYREPQLKKSKVDVVPIIKATLANCSAELDEKDITIRESMESIIPVIHLDKGQFENVLVNIILNAIYYSPQKGEIQLKCSRENNNIVISICDEGPGIAEDNIEKIFHPFFTTKSSGSGLGLAIAQNIVRAHNGDITVINLPGKGTCFNITFPIT